MGPSPALYRGARQDAGPVEQNAIAALRIADRCIILDDGEVAFRADPKTILADETIRRDYLAV